MDTQDMSTANEMVPFDGNHFRSIRRQGSATERSSPCDNGLQHSSDRLRDCQTSPFTLPATTQIQLGTSPALKF